MKRKTLITLIIAGVTLVVMLSIGITVLLIHALPVNTASQSGSIIETEIDEPDIDWVGGTVRIVPYDESFISFEETEGLSAGNRLVSKVSGTKLTIRSRKSRLFQVKANKDLTLYLPRDTVLRELDIKTVSADAEITCTQVKELNIDTVSGNIQFTGDMVGDIESETVSGDIRITVNNCPQSIESDSTSGDFTVTLPTDAAFMLTTDTVSGKLNNEFPVAQTGPRFQLSSVSGNFNILKAAK